LHKCGAAGLLEKVRKAVERLKWAGEKILVNATLQTAKIGLDE